MRSKKAVVLLSGGLDSSTCLFWAIKNKYKCLALCFNYGQRHRKEVARARAICKKTKTPIVIIPLKLPWLKVSSLVDKNKRLPDVCAEKIGAAHVPSTYVPARNMMFCALAVSFAEAENADAVILGPNALDYSGYPDCRPGFFRAMKTAAKLGTKKGAGGKAIKIITPIIRKSKAQIVKLAKKLGVPLGLTWSCYKGGKTPCGKCDSCKLRAKGFAAAGVKDD